MNDHCIDINDLIAPGSLQIESGLPYVTDTLKETGTPTINTLTVPNFLIDDHESCEQKFTEEELQFKLSINPDKFNGKTSENSLPLEVYRGKNCDDQKKDREQKLDLIRKSGMKRPGDIKKDLEKYKDVVPGQVLQRANIICDQMRIPIKKGKPRKKLIFVCMAYAFEDCGIPKIHKEVAQLVDLDPGKIASAFHDYDEMKTGYRHVRNQNITLITEIERFISDYWRRLGLEKDNLADAQRFCTDIFKKDCANQRKLESSHPQNIAAGLLRYYCDVHGFIVHRESYATSVVNLSPATVNKIVSLVCEIHNS